MHTSQNKTKKVVVITRAANGIGIVMINDIVERELKQTARYTFFVIAKKISGGMNNNAINHNDFPII
jgi:hypothetical protein